MTIPTPHEGLTDSILRMRTCLSRVELAASRIARDAATPASRDLATGISQTVFEIDDEIGEALRSLRTQPDANPDVGDCRLILAELRDRMSPILKAHEINWPPRDVEDACLIADPVALEFAALVMLRTGIALAGQGGEIDLTLVRDPETSGIGLRLVTERADEDNTETGRNALIRACSLAQRHRGSLIVRETEGSTKATLWLAVAEAK